MERVSLEELNSCLDTGILQNICVQAWLGHGNPLFLGFGHEVIFPRIPGVVGRGTETPIPPYQLRSFLADWWVKYHGEVVGWSEDSEDKSDATILLLVGQQPVSCRVLQERWGLEVEFAPGLVLEVQPYESEKYPPTKEIWGIRDPEGYYTVIRRNGEIYREHEDEDTR